MVQQQCLLTRWVSEVLGIATGAGCLLSQQVQRPLHQQQDTMPLQRGTAATARVKSWQLLIPALSGASCCS